MYKNGTQNDTPKARKMEIAKDGKWLIRLPGENSKKEEVAVEWRGTSKSEVDLTLMLVLDKDKPLQMQCLGLRIKKGEEEYPFLLLLSI